MSADHNKNYQRRKDRAAARDRAESAAGKEIGDLPPVAKPRRRESCRLNLLKFLATYCGESFPLAFSTDQLDFIAAIQSAVLDGGARAQAMPRGSGKTTIILAACCWAAAYGHRRFIVLIGAEQEAADELCDDFRVIWETNDLLAQDFPEVAAPIRALEGVTQRAKAQTCGGRLTHLRWSGAKLALPSVWVAAGDVRARHGATPNDRGLVPTASSACVIRGRGLLGRLRGMKSTTPTGETIRPDLVLVEDFQTDASAASEIQCAKRERTIAGAVLGLAGPGKRIAAFATCTVIRLGDAADRILNRKLYPKWRGRRCQLVDAWPTDAEALKHWERYQEIRAGEIAAADDADADSDAAAEHPRATAYYRRHRRIMDAGAQIPWAARKFPHELSAHEHAQNLRADNPDTFDSEYQNQPRDTVATVTDLRLLRSDDHVVNITDHRRRELPDDTQWLTVGIDVQQSILFYSVLAIDAHYGGSIVDYGTWPEQPAAYVATTDVEVTIQAATGAAAETRAIPMALTALVAELQQQTWSRPDGTTARIDRGLVDSGYQTETVYKWARSTTAPFLPSMGFGVGAKQKPWDTIRRSRGERAGFGWRMPATAKTRGVRRVDIDVNSWKTAILPRFALPDDEPGKLRLFRASPTRHRMIADHLAAEYAVKTEGRGRTLYEWSRRPNAENHLLDTTILAAVAANLDGARLPEESTAAAPKTRPPKSVGASRRPMATSTGRPRMEDQRDGRERLSMRELRQRAREKKT